MIKDWIWSTQGMLTLCGLLLVGILGLSFWLAYREDAQWQQYAKTHHCRAIGKKSGQVTTSFDSKGRLVTGIGSDQTIYVCDDGEMQIR